MVMAEYPMVAHLQLFWQVWVEMLLRGILALIVSVLMGN
jgi:hypothetical protein